METNKPTIWVVGKTGILARAFAAFFDAEDIRFIATSHLEVDITDSGAVQSFLEDCRPKLVINCAAYTNVALAEKEIEKARKLNATAPKQLAHLCKKYAAKLIHFSTDFVFDGFKEGGFTEEDQPSPKTAYGKSKLEGERLVLKEDPTALIVRLSWLYGPGKTHFVGKVLNKLANGERLKVVNDQRGSLTSAYDVAPAIFSLRHASEILHFSGRGESSWYDVAAFLAKTVDPENDAAVQAISSKELADAVPRPSYSYLNCTKCEKMLARELDSWQETLLKYLQGEGLCAQ